MFKKESNIGLIATIVGCTVLICGSLIFLGLQLGGGSGLSENTNTSREDSLAPYMNDATADTKHDDAVLGNKDAKVQIVEYSDYQCPFCRKFFLEAYSQVKSEYIETGLAKLIFKDFPLDFHTDAIYAHNAAECARKVSDDETYYAFHDSLFEAQGPVTNGTVSITDKMIQEIAKKLDVDTKELEACIEDKEFYAEIAGDFTAAIQTTANRIAEIDPTTREVVIRPATEEEKTGVNATPTIFVNDIKIIGAQPFEVFQYAIDSELNK
jgi:protein-disulfide isomerase